METDAIPVTEVAREFLAKAGYPFVWLEKATQDADGLWRLAFSIGIYRQATKTVLIDSKTTKVVGLE